MDELEKLPDEIARALGRLDARAGQRAARIDPERVSAAVTRRLREQPDVSVLSSLGRRYGLVNMVRVAAALAILVTAGVVGTRLLERPAAGAKWLPVVDVRAARVLSTARADSLIRAADHIQPLNASVAGSSASVEELNTQELRALLQAMQSSEEGTE